MKDEILPKDLWNDKKRKAVGDFIKNYSNDQTKERKTTLTKMKKPLALLLTDTHLSENNIDLVTDIWQQAIDKCEEIGTDQIFFLGDFFHSRKGQPLSVLKASQKIIEMLKINNIYVKAIAGNHDKASYISEDSFMDILDCDNFVIFDKPNRMLIDNVAISFISYFKEGSEIWKKYFDQISNPVHGKINIILTHIAINGSVTNDNEYIDNCIPSSDFENFDKIFVGHFHNRNEFENIVYIGSTYQANYGEDSNKGFTILYNDGSYEFTRSKFPEYRKYSIDISNLEESEILELHKEKEEGHNIKIEITGDIAKVKSFDKSKLKDLGIEVSDNSTSEKIDVNDAKVKFDSKDIIGKFDEFCKDIKADNVEYGMEKVKLIRNEAKI